jgi:hypothetical protein
VGQYHQGWYVGSQQAPMLNFRVYPWNTNISGSIMQNVAAGASALYQTTKGTSSNASAFANAVSPFTAFFNHIDNLD